MSKKKKQLTIREEIEKEISDNRFLDYTYHAEGCDVVFSTWEFLDWLFEKFNITKKSEV
jgi:hypothetical protein